MRSPEERVPPRFESRAYGPWFVRSELGRGGMGKVFEVERYEPHQMAALKVLHGTWASDEEKRRFRREQEILAGLEHPNIGRFLDAGGSGEGDLYLVMEKIEGEPIDEYCKALPWRARLPLFLAVCQAVAAAHRQLIVHCDLKPSNVLVRRDGVVKLLDFGLARSVDQRLATGTLQSSFSTWAYASPEQLGGNVVSAAADVYSLGVLLCEILTEKRLFALEQESLLLSVEARDSPRPASAMLPPEGWHGLRGSLQGSLQGSLRRALEEDLDFVIAKALRREPQERYGSVEELIADLEAFLSGAPVKARRLDRGYVLRRWARRHAFALAIGLLLLVTALGATFSLARQSFELRAERDQARLEEKRATQVSSFLLGMLERPAESADTDLQVQAFVDRAVVELDQHFESDPVVRGELLILLGEFYRLNRVNASAESLFREGLRLQVEEYGFDHPKNGLAICGLAMTLLRIGEVEEGCRLARQAAELESGRRSLGSRITGLNTLALCATAEKKFAEAAELFQRAEILSRVPGGQALRDVELLNLIWIWEWLGEVGKLEVALERGIQERLKRRHRPDRMMAEWAFQLAQLELRGGNVSAAEEHLQWSLSVLESPEVSKYPRSTQGLSTADLELTLAELKLHQGDLARALELVRSARRDLVFEVPPDHVVHAEAKRIEGMTLLRMGAVKAAKSLLQEALPALEDGLGADDPRVVELQSVIAGSFKAPGLYVD